MRTWTVSTLAAISIFAAAATTAHAQPIPGGATTAPAVEEDPPPSFAWQIVAADVLAAGAGIGAANLTGSGYPLVGLWAFSAPIVHLAHGDGTGAAESLALHLLVPAAAGFIGYQVETSSCRPGEWFCGLAGAGIGIMVGAVIATTVDAAALSSPPRHNLTAATPAKRFLAMPTLAVNPAGGVMLGLTGRL